MQDDWGTPWGANQKSSMERTFHTKEIVWGTTGFLSCFSVCACQLCNEKVVTIYYCPVKTEGHGCPCVPSFRPAIPHCFGKGRPPPCQTKFVGFRLSRQAVSFPGIRRQACEPSAWSVFADNTIGFCQRHNRYLPTTQSVSGISTSCRGASFVPLMLIHMQEGMNGFHGGSPSDGHHHSIRTSLAEWENAQRFQLDFQSFFVPLQPIRIRIGFFFCFGRVYSLRYLTGLRLWLNLFLIK